MKVTNHKDSVELSQLSKGKKSDKAHSAKGKNADGAEAASSPIGDVANVEISGEAKAMSAANQVMKSDNVDQAKIDRIKAAINGGTYKPDYGKVSEKMINESLMQELS